MIPSFSLPRLVVSLSVVAVVLGLGGCGRRNDPELPTIERKAEPRPVGIPIGPTPIDAPATPAKPQPKTPFLLDFLL